MRERMAGRDTRVRARVGWTDGGAERVHARPNAWAFARALDGRRGYGETSPSTSARAIYCARHMYAHSAYEHDTSLVCKHQFLGR